MARSRLTARKRVLVPPQRIQPGANWASQPVIRAESNGLHAGYFPLTLKKLLSGLGYHDAPTYFGKRMPLRYHGYIWRVWVETYEQPTSNHTRIVRKTYYASSARATFEDGIRDAAREALARIRYEMDEELDHQQYAHFPMKAHEGSDAYVLHPRNEATEQLKEQVNFTLHQDEEMTRVLEELEFAYRRIARYEDTIDELHHELATRDGDDDNNGDDADDEDPDGDEGPEGDDEDDGGDDGGDTPVQDVPQEEEEEEPFEREWEPEDHEERLPSPTPEEPALSRERMEYEAFKRRILEDSSDEEQLKFVVSESS